MREKPRVIDAPDVKEIHDRMLGLIGEIMVAIQPIIKNNNMNIILNAFMLILINWSAQDVKTQAELDEIADALCQAIKGNCKNFNLDEEK